MDSRAFKGWAAGLMFASLLILANTAAGAATTRFEPRALTPLRSFGVANTLASTVVSENGITKCYSGVPVHLQRRVAPGVWRHVRTFRTAPDGRFDFRLDRRGTHRFSAPRIKVTVNGEQVVCKRAALRFDWGKAS